MTGTPQWAPQIVEKGVPWLERVLNPTAGARTQAGGPAKVDAHGLLPDTGVVFRLHSCPRVLGTAVADDNGRVTTWQRLPLNVPTGQHSLIVEGLDPDGQLIAGSRTITVLPQGGWWLYVALGLGAVLFAGG